MNNVSPWVGPNACPRSAAIPWLTEEEFVSGVIYVATSEHKEVFYQLAGLANKPDNPLDKLAIQG